MVLKKELINIAKEAQEAARFMLAVPSSAKNGILKQMAKAVISSKKEILSQNMRDVTKARAKGLSSAFIDRLSLTDKRINEMSDSLLQVARLNDPVGEVMKSWKRPNGLRIDKVRTAIGVIAIIFESRPNVTCDCAGLCFKSSNSVILKGGSESLHSNLCIGRLLRNVLRKNNMPEGLVNIVETTDRKAVDILLKLNDYIDLVIPRGGEALIKHVTDVSRVPVIKHYKGICHIYVDDYADLNIAHKVCFNAKVQRPGVCNAMETMLVHKDVAARFLPGMIKDFRDAGVQIRGCAVTRKIVKGVKPATDKDYHTEYLDLVLSVKVVDSLGVAIDHINHYGSRHSDAIITENSKIARVFLNKVDSACVYVNASTRFTDGNQFGMGAEIGISTDKLHARGPMALEELTTYKYMIYGNGQIRQ